MAPRGESERGCGLAAHLPAGDQNAASADRKRGRMKKNHILPKSQRTSIQNAEQLRSPIRVRLTKKTNVIAIHEKRCFARHRYFRPLPIRGGSRLERAVWQGEAEKNIVYSVWLTVPSQSHAAVIGLRVASKNARGNESRRGRAQWYAGRSAECGEEVVKQRIVVAVDGHLALREQSTARPHMAGRSLLAVRENVVP